MFYEDSMMDSFSEPSKATVLHTPFPLLVFLASCASWTVTRSIFSIWFKNNASHLVALVHSILYASYLAASRTSPNPSASNSSDEELLLMIGAGYLGHLLWFNGVKTSIDKLRMVSILTSIIVLFRFVIRGSGGNVALTYLFFAFSTAPSRVLTGLGSSCYKMTRTYFHVFCASWAFVIYQFLIITLPMTWKLFNDEQGAKLIADIFLDFTVS